MRKACMLKQTWAASDGTMIGASSLCQAFPVQGLVGFTLCQGHGCSVMVSASSPGESSPPKAREDGATFQGAVYGAVCTAAACKRERARGGGMYGC